MDRKRGSPRRDLLSRTVSYLPPSLSNRIIVQLLRSKRNSLLRKRPPPRARELISREEYCKKEKKKKRQKEGGCFRAMDTIKVAWMSKAKAKKLSVSIPRGSLHVSTLQGEGKGRLLSHSMLRIKSLLIFQEAHSPILPFAHLLCFSILPPPPLFLSSLTPLFFFFPLPYG